jgi:hypothetical protein
MIQVIIDDGKGHVEGWGIRGDFTRSDIIRAVWYGLEKMLEVAKCELCDCWAKERSGGRHVDRDDEIDGLQEDDFVCQACLDKREHKDT